MSYDPTSAPASYDQVWMRTELNKIREAMFSPKPFEYLQEQHVAPPKPRDGMVVLADGVDWNPGAGPGYYGYINGKWVATNAFPPLYRSGGNLSTTVNTVTVSAGAWRSLANDADVILTAPLTKTLQSAPWVAGAGNSGLFVGVRAPSTWYHVFVMRNSTTGAVDVGFDTSVSGANCPLGWSIARRLGSVFSDGITQLRPIGQVGNEFYWLDRVSDVTAGPVSSVLGGTAVTITTPRGVRVMAHLSLFLGPPTGTDITIQVFPPDASETSLTGPGARGDLFRSGSNLNFGHKDVLTGTSSDIRVRGSANESSVLNIATTGWRDFLSD